MMKEKWNIRKTAGLLAAALAAVAIAVVPGYATGQNGEGETGSLALTVGEESSFREDLTSARWDVAVYRIASYASLGNCVAEEGFEDVTEVINASESLTAEETQELAYEAARIAGWQEDGQMESLEEPDAWVEMTDCQGLAEDLSTGIWLVISGNALTENYEYSFQPSLLTIPRQQESGEWSNDVTAILKPEQNPRYGSLRITKSLDSYNESLGKVTFVFQIEGVNENGETVYSNVTATTHEGPGTEEALVEQIPAGLTVTVTEVYSGASYRLTSEASRTGVITADEELGMEFTNTYDDELVPGYGAVNQFEYDEDNGWQWSRLESGGASE